MLFVLDGLGMLLTPDSQSFPKKKAIKQNINLKIASLLNKYQKTKGRNRPNSIFHLLM